MANRKSDSEIQLVPTPRKGQSIVWVQGGVTPGEPVNQEEMHAAVCAEVEGYGRIAAWVFPANGSQPFFKKNARHVSDPNWATKRSGDQNSGAWDYVKDFENSNQFEEHQNFLQRQRDQRDKVEQQRVAAEAKLRALKQAREQAIKQPADT